MEEISAFKFPHHLGFHDVTVLSYCFKQKNLSFPTTETTQSKIQDGGMHIKCYIALIFVICN